MTPQTISPALTPAQMRLCATYRNLGLWTLQGWIAMFFVAAGYAKLTEPMGNLVALLHWPAMASEAFVRGLGIAEVVLALGVLVPLVSWKVGRPMLLVSALGLAILQAVMLGVHALGGQIGLALVNAVLLAITLPVLIGRRS